MAKLTIAIALGVLAMPLLSVAPARAESASAAAPADTSSDSGSENLITGKPTFGGYGGPEIKGTPIMHVGSALVGGQGGMILNHTLVLGGAGYGMLTRSTLPAELQTPGASRRLSFGYGGGRIEWLIVPRSLVHGAVGALIGGGGIVWESADGTYTNQNTSTQTDAFFVFEPHVAVELNVHRLMRIDAVASYRWVSGVDSPGLSNSDFRGVAFGAVTKFGVF